MKTLLKFLIGFFLLLVVACFTTAVLMVDNKASVTSIAAAGVEDAKASYKIVKTLQRNLLKYKTPFDLSLSEAEINGQFVLLNRAIPRVKGTAQLSDKLNIKVTLELPRNPIGSYVNIHCDVLPSARGLVIDKLSVGSIPLPESLTVSLVKTFLDNISGQDLGTVSFNAIERVDITNDQFSVSIAAIPDLRERLDKTKERFKSTRDMFPQFGNPELVRYYYQKIMQYDQAARAGSKDSLTGPIQAIFSVALQRNGNAVEENKAAILALAMFYGSEQVSNFVGNVRTPEMNTYYKRNPKLTMKRRNDLTRHFIISAALKIISERDITNAIGEFKELMDARKGGSGFSFVDLAADRAGVKFAESMLNPKTARIMQKLLSDGAEESLIFPNIYGLPEHISQAAFEQQYSHIDSPEYKRLVERIDGCIAELPAYKLGQYSVSQEITACKF